MTDWTAIAPKRFDNAVDALRKVTRTAGRDYDVPADAARAELAKLDEAVDALRRAYSGRLDQTAETTPEPEMAVPAPPQAPARAIPSAKLADSLHHHQIAGFVAALPFDQLPAFLTHIGNRLCEAAERKGTE